jgi:hypothetical protein
MSCDNDIPTLGNRDGVSLVICSTETRGYYSIRRKGCVKATIRVITDYREVIALAGLADAYS